RCQEITTHVTEHSETLIATLDEEFCSSCNMLLRREHKLKATKPKDGKVQEE
ncbi:hypothetical protein LCGC14_2850840, partial [marine sediment metagenome]